MSEKKDDVFVQKCIKTWLGYHGEFEATLKKEQPKITTITVGSNQLTFIILYKFNANGYGVALGFYVENNKLLIRHFYKSNSESTWRVGCGFRPGGEWVKGGEYILPKLSITKDGIAGGSITGGYIFECLLHYRLEEKIEALEEMFCSETRLSKNILEVVKKTNPLEEEPNFEKYYAYFFQRGKNPNGISQEYVKSRNAVNVFKHPRPETTALYEKSQVSFQQNSSLARDLKNDALWKIIIPCVRDRPLLTYEFNHDLLTKWNKSLIHPSRKNCIAEVYRLREVSEVKVLVEIARTKDEVELTFNTATMEPTSIKSPICWVKNIYIEGSIESGDRWGMASTFGNYYKYPQDLAFLVQKPMDYLSQVMPEELDTSLENENYNLSQLKDSKELTKGHILSGHTKIDDAYKSIFKFGSRDQKIIDMNREDGLRPLSLERTNVKANLYYSKGKFKYSAQGDNAIDSYVLLAWYNEKYSPLIREYKSKKGFELFRYKSRKYAKSRESEIPIILESLDAKEVNATIKAGIASYLLHRGNRVTKTGEERALNFINVLTPANGEVLTLSDIDQILDDLFLRNRIDGRVYSDFLGFGGKIKTDENSLFTVVTKTLLSQLFCYQALSAWIAYFPKNSQLLLRNRFMLNQNSFIKRLLMEALLLGIPYNPDHLTAEQSAALLNAVKRR